MTAAGADGTGDDTVRARHAVCVHCGYHLAGIAVVDQAILCPECGELSRLEAVAPRRRGDRGLGCLLMVGLLVLAVGVPVAFMMRSEWRLIAGLAAAVILLAALPRVLRRVFDV